MKALFSSIPNETQKKASQHAQHDAGVLKKILATPFSLVPFSNQTKKVLTDFKKLKLPKYTKICVVGLGGSSLGTKAFAHAVNATTIDFLDNVDPLFVTNFLQNLRIKDTLFFIISKSGSTVEVMSLTKILLAHDVPADRCVGISESNDSELITLLKKHGVRNLFTCDPEVPGRFSVLSPVGLLPLCAAGVDVEKMIAQLAKKNFEEAVTLARITYELSLKGKTIIPLFIYSESLQFFADWFVQLLAESIGKSPTIGLTPIKAVGVKDQHAQLQLFLDGPHDKFFIFIKPENPVKPLLISGSDYTLNQLFDAEFGGVIDSFAQRKLPLAQLHPSGELGNIVTELFYFFEIYVAALGTLFKIDYQTQPAVELSKSLTRDLLKKVTTK